MTVYQVSVAAPKPSIVFFFLSTFLIQVVEFSTRNVSVSLLFGFGCVHPSRVTG